MFSALLPTGAIVSFMAGVVVGFIATNSVRTKQIESLRHEFSQLQSVYKSTELAYRECNTEMHKIKVDYAKRIKDFHKALQERSKYSALVDIKAKEEQDECQALRELLDIYRTIELSK